MTPSSPASDLELEYARRLAETLPRVRDEIQRAAEAAGRSASDVQLIAVTKNHPLDCLRAAIAAGLTDLGENRVGELEDKVAALGREGLRWHMIGSVQSRKAARLVGLADLVHSVDRLKLARKLDAAATEIAAAPEPPPAGGASDTAPSAATPPAPTSHAASPCDILVQVNTSGEDAKSGFSRSEAVDAVLQIAELEHLRVHGLMTMAPFVDDEAVLRTTFRRLREVLDDVRAADPSVGPELSMGMTNDLRYAIEEGSTMVRIGTALFGERPGYTRDD